MVYCDFYHITGSHRSIIAEFVKALISVFSVYYMQKESFDASFFFFGEGINFFLVYPRDNTKSVSFIRQTNFKLTIFLIFN